MTRTLAHFYACPPGTVVRLSESLSVKIGTHGTYPPHPSGRSFGASVVVTAAFLGSLGHPLVKVVSRFDPTFREVVADAADFAA